MADFDLLTTDVPTGLSVIEASAGTGKTWTISHLVPRLLVDGVIGGIGDVLLVTFTEDAARELGERTRRQLATLVGHASAGTRPAADHGPGIRGLLDRLAALPAAQRSAATLRLRLALDESDQLAVSTIHAFCKQVLEAEGFLCGMPAGFEVLADPGDARSDAVKDTWRADLAADSLLASVVACGGGSVEEDLKAWRSLTRRPSTRMDPEPLSLRDARGRVARALEALREARADIRRLQEIAGRDSVKLNNSAGSPGADSVAQLDAWYTKLETLDRQPPVEIFRLAGRLAAAKCWFGRRSALGRGRLGRGGHITDRGCSRGGGGRPRSNRLGLAGAPAPGRWAPIRAQPAPKQRRHLRRVDRAPASRAVCGTQPRGSRPAVVGQVEGGAD